MVDGRRSFETKEISKFGGLNAYVDPTKDEFQDSESPYLKNCLNKRSILEARQGRTRINATRYDNVVTSLTSYVDRSNVTHLVFSVQTVATDPTTPDGTIQETH